MLSSRLALRNEMHFCLLKVDDRGYTIRHVVLMNPYALLVFRVPKYKSYKLQLTRRMIVGRA